MKNIFTLIIAVFCLTTLSSQEYKLSHSSGKLIINGVDEVSIVGYDGSEIVFTSDTDLDKGEEDRAKGLKLVNSSGATDNTGLGLSVTKRDGNVIVEKVGNNCNCDEVRIRLPKKMGVEYTHKNYNGDDLKIENISGEIVVSAMYNDVKLINVTGPMSVKSVYGGIDAVFSTLAQNGSVSLNSIYDYVDVTFPTSSKFNVSVSTPYGNIYSDIEIDVKTTGEGMREISGSKLRGTVNSGGVDVTIKSSYENVYLRKK